MNKSITILILFCVAFTIWWSWTLDAGPLVYRHKVPDSLTLKIKNTFYPYLDGRSITSIRFGSNNVHKSKKVPVIVTTEESEEWETSNANTGVIKLNVDLVEKSIELFWDIPKDTTLDDANTLLSQSLWDVLVQYDDINKIKSTYE